MNNSEFMVTDFSDFLCSEFDVNEDNRVFFSRLCGFCQMISDSERIYYGLRSRARGFSSLDLRSVK